MNSQDGLEQLKQVVFRAEAPAVCAYLSDNIEQIFSIPDLAACYRALKGVDLAGRPALPQLVVAWLAFLSGDNGRAAALMGNIRQTQLGASESSLLYSLKAISGFFTEGSARFTFARLAIDVLPQGDTSFCMANAQLTYGQLLAGAEKYRDAAGAFSKAHTLFQAHQMMFPAVVAFVNEMLNIHKLGELPQVLGRCSQALAMSANYTGEIHRFYDIINLPVGMCYYDMNKPSLAQKHLNAALKAIDELALLHMHGITELYLFKACLLLKDNEGMRAVLEKAEADFGHVNDPSMDLLLSMFRIFCAQDAREVRPDIERFEVEYAAGLERTPYILPEAMACLKLRGYSDVLQSEDVEKLLCHARYTGLVHCVQMCLVLLAELRYRDGKEKESANFLREAAAIKTEFSLCAPFFVLPLACGELLGDIDPSLLDALRRRSLKMAEQKPSALTEREREILRLAAEGKSNAEIGRELYMGVGTIKWYMNQIFRKLDAASRIEAVDKARKLDLI